EHPSPERPGWREYFGDAKLALEPIAFLVAIVLGLGSIAGWLAGFHKLLPWVVGAGCAAAVGFGLRHVRRHAWAALGPLRGGVPRWPGRPLLDSKAPPESRGWLRLIESDGLLWRVEHGGRWIVGEPQAECPRCREDVRFRQFEPPSGGQARCVNPDCGYEVA